MEYGFYLLAGFGFSLCYVSAFSIVPLYFDGRKRMVSLGFISMGSGFGGVAIPLLLQFLLKIYTWRGALLIFGGFAFQMCVSAAVIAPLRSIYYRVKPRHITQNKNPAKTMTTELSVNNKQYARKYPIKAADNTSVLKKFLDVMRDRRFLVFAISMMMSITSFNVVLIFLIDFYEANGIDRSTSVLLYTIMSSTSILLRILPGCIVQMQCIPKLAIPCGFMFVNSLALLLFPFAEDITQYAALACMFGVSVGGLSWTGPSATIVLIGEENYSTAFGLILTSIGISNTIAGPITGNFYFFF